MIPDKNQARTSPTDQPTTEPVNNPQPSQYRPDWIIPDNGSSSRKTHRADEQQRNPQEDSIPLNNDETLGIP